MVSALLGVMSPSLWTHALCSLTDDLERKMGKACWQDSDRTTLRGEGDITDGRVQIPKRLESLDSHQPAFNINSCTQVQKVNCRGGLGETSLMDCIRWMRISFLGKCWIHCVPCSHAVYGETCSVLGMELKKDPTKVECVQRKVPETLSHLEIVANKTNLPRQGKGRQSGDKMVVFKCSKLWCLEEEVGFFALIP